MQEGTRFGELRIRGLPACILIFLAAMAFLPLSAAEASQWWIGGNFTAPAPGGFGLNFGGGTNGHVNAIECISLMDGSKILYDYRYCLVGGNFTEVGSGSTRLVTGGGLGMWDNTNQQWSKLGGHTWSTGAEVFAIKTTTVYDRVALKFRTVSFVGGFFTEQVNPTVNATGSGTEIFNFMIHNGNEWEETSFNYGFDKAVYGITTHQTLQNCDYTIEACAADVYVVGAFGTTSDFAVPTRRVAVGRYSDREYVSGTTATFLIKYTWSYISSNDVPSYATCIIHCGLFLYVGGTMESGIYYTSEFNSTYAWKRVSTGLEGAVNSLACVNFSVVPTLAELNVVPSYYGQLHVGGNFMTDDGLVVSNYRYHVVTTTNSQQDWLQVGRQPQKTEISCDRCTGTDLPLGSPVTSLKSAFNAHGQYYTLFASAGDKIYEYAMGNSHPHQISYKEVRLSPAISGNTIRTFFTDRKSASSRSACTTLFSWIVVVIAMVLS